MATVRDVGRSGHAERTRLLDLYGQMVAHAEHTIDFNASDEEFAAQLRANREFEAGLKPQVEEARKRVRLVHAVIRRPRPLQAFVTPRRHVSAPRPRGQRARRTSAPTRGSPTSSRDSDSPGPPLGGDWDFLGRASERMAAHLRRRGAKRALA